MKTNVKKEAVRTFGGAVASVSDAEETLRRSVMANLLWENQFYEDGESIADRLKKLIPQVDPVTVCNIAIEARSAMKLRHVPLLIAREMLRYQSHKPYVAGLLAEIIQRADEMGEFLSMYWQDQPNASIAAQVKKGLRKAFAKFNSYNLAKYDNNSAAVRPRDVMFLTHPKPTQELTEVYKKIANDELESPDTWEVQLSAGKDKKETWERLLQEEKLGALALLRNLRNMQTAKVDEDLIKDAFRKIKVDRVLPFRFISAAKYAPRLESEIQEAMFKCLEGVNKLLGKTVLVIDVSGSMTGALSSKSDISRMESAFALSILARELCENVQIYVTAGDDYKRVHKTEIVPNRRGFALSDIMRQQYQKMGGGGIFLKQCMDYVYEHEKTADRIVVFTDEVDCDIKCNPADAKAFGKHNYIVNIASTENGIAYKKFTHINGFSEAVLNYIYYTENSNNRVK